MLWFILFLSNAAAAALNASVDNTGFAVFGALFAVFCLVMFLIEEV